MSGRQRAKWIARLGLMVVLAHLLVMLAHNAAHDELGVELSALQLGYATLVILLAPIGALILLFTRWARLGAILLAAAMAGALVFGVYWHYVAVSPDHVSHLPAGDAQGLFRLTALGLAAVEAVGVVVGLWGWSRLRRAGGSG